MDPDFSNLDDGALDELRQTLIHQIMNLSINQNTSDEEDDSDDYDDDESIGSLKGLSFVTSEDELGESQDEIASDQDDEEDEIIVVAEPEDLSDLESDGIGGVESEDEGNPQEESGQSPDEPIKEQQAEDLTQRTSSVRFADEVKSNGGHPVETVLSPTAAIDQASKSIPQQQESFDEEPHIEDAIPPVNEDTTLPANGDTTLPVNGDAPECPDPALDVVEDTSASTTTKKKKKKKKKTEKGFPVAENDDFEEVATPELFAPEGIYDPKLPVDDRFRSAMESFRKERVFNSLTSRLLASYFSHGGMDESIQGRQDIALDIDIPYVNETFLSTYMFGRSGWYDPIDFELAPRLVAAFIKYLLAKRVLPEYKKDLLDSLALSFEVKRQAPKCRRFNSLMPDWVSGSLSALLLQDYEFEKVLEENLVCLEKELGSEVTTAKKSGRTIEVSRKRGLARVIENKQAGQAPLPSNMSNGANANGSRSICKVRLTEFISGNSGDDQEDQTDVWSDWYIYLGSEAAAQLEPGVVLYGNFYRVTIKNTPDGQTSNEQVKEQERPVIVTFARPCMAYPACYREEDVYESDD